MIDLKSDTAAVPGIGSGSSQHAAKCELTATGLEAARARVTNAPYQFCGGSILLIVS